jgi:hypothetical protein
VGQDCGHRAASSAFGFNDRCDVIVVLATLGAGDRDVLEPAVLAFLNSERVQRWVKWLLL